MKAGKHTKINKQANAILVKVYRDKDIMSCEIGKDDCTGQLYLQFAHRHKRDWYWERGRDALALLSSFSETLLACTGCHQKIEFDEDETERLFSRLRPDAV